MQEFSITYFQSKLVYLNLHDQNFSLAGSKSYFCFTRNNDAKNNNTVISNVQVASLMFLLLFTVLLSESQEIQGRKIWVAGKMGTENSHFCHFFFTVPLPFPEWWNFWVTPCVLWHLLKKKRNRVKTLSKFYYGFFLQKLLTVKSRWPFSKQSCVYGDWQGAKSPLLIP